MSARRREETGAPSPGKAKAAVRKAPRCPICGKPTNAEFRPFCSRRCTNIDLGRWLGGRYAVPGEPIGRASGDEPLSPEDEDAGC